MSLRIKAVVDKFVEELKEALNADIQDRIMKDREMQSYIQEREREVAEREAAWKDDLSCREVHKISQANVNTEIIFNCQMGRGRTTTGMVIAILVYLNRIGASGTFIYLFNFSDLIVYFLSFMPFFLSKKFSSIYSEKPLFKVIVYAHVHLVGNKSNMTVYNIRIGV